jgi:hypothetical protein
MDLSKMRRLGYAWMVVNGALALVAPKIGVKLNTMGWRCAFDNVGELEPKPWYVRTTRAVGGGLVVTGLLGLLQEERASGATDAEAEAELESETESLTE